MKILEEWKIDVTRSVHKKGNKKCCSNIGVQELLCLLEDCM